MPGLMSHVSYHVMDPESGILVSHPESVFEVMWKMLERKPRSRLGKLCSAQTHEQVLGWGGEGQHKVLSIYRSWISVTATASMTMSSSLIGWVFFMIEIKIMPAFQEATDLQLYPELLSNRSSSYDGSKSLAGLGISNKTMYY